jgi:hypothetical protein
MKFLIRVFRSSFTRLLSLMKCFLLKKIDSYQIIIIFSVIIIIFLNLLSLKFLYVIINIVNSDN